MKRFTVVILSLLLFFNSSLFIIIYSLKVYQISQNAQSKIHLLRSNEICNNVINPEITVFKISLNDPELNRACQRINDDEIICNGYYFDIICERTIDDTLFIYCIQDYEEDEMLCAMILHLENEENKKQELQYFNILFSFLSNVINYNYYFEFPLLPQQKMLAECMINYIQSIPDIPAPPPRITV